MRLPNTLRSFKERLGFSTELLLLVLFFITLPLKNSYNSISILLVLLFSLPKFQFSKLKELQFYPFLLAYFFFSCISLFYTTDLKSGTETLLGHSLFLVLPFVFTQVNFSLLNIKRAQNYFIAWVCLLALYSESTTIWNLLQNDQSLFLWFRKDFSYINLGAIIGVHPPYMSLFTSYCVLLLIDKIGLNQMRNLVYALVIMFLLFYTIHLSSRLPIVALLFVSTLFIFRKLTLYNSFFKAFLKLFILVGLVFILLISVRATRYRFAEIFGMKYSSGLYVQSGTGKLEQWTAAYQANENMLFGNGLGDVKSSIIASNLKHGLLKNASRKYNAHNQYIQTFVGLGFLGLLLLLGMFLYSWDSKKPFLKLHNYLLVYLALVFMSESYLQRHHGIVFIIFVFCAIQQQKKALKLLAKK